MAARVPGVLGRLTAAAGVAAAALFIIHRVARAAAITGLLQIPEVQVAAGLSALSGLADHAAHLHSHQPTSVLNHGIY
jgi:hypothetical protein